MFSLFHGTSSEIGRRYFQHSYLYSVVITFLSILGAAALIVYFRPILNSYASQHYSSPLLSTESPAIEQYNTTQERKKVIGFLPSWNITPQLRTHPEYLDQIIYFGIGVNKKGELMKKDDDGNLLLEWQYLDSPAFLDIRTRAEKTNTKILVTIKNFDNTTIDTVISNPAATARLIADIKQLVVDYRLDGIDVNFEYFTDVDFPTRKHLVSFLKTLRSQLSALDPQLILSFDVNASVIYQDTAYDMVNIAQYVDQIIVMGYDYTRTDSAVASAVSPLYASGDRPSVSRSIDSLLGRVPREKIILALPLYGYEWQTYTTKLNSATIPDTGALASYRRIRDLIAHQDVAISYDPITHTPRIMYRQNGIIHQIHYEDERSMKEKIDLVKEKELQGIALWALGYEGTYIEPWRLINDQIFRLK